MTDRVIYKKSPSGFKGPPGSWRLPELKDEFARHVGVKAYLVCRNGHDSSIRTHKIAADGMVTPSLVCPMASYGCIEHTFGILEGWNS